jgi:flagellar basal body-associated protein FliL
VPDEAEQPKRKRKPAFFTLGIVLAVALLEGGAFLAVMKIFGGSPGVAYGVEGNHVMEGEPPTAAEELSEVALLQSFRVPNTKTGQTIVYDFDISVAVPLSRKPEIEQVIKGRDAEIRDRVAQIIRQARPQVLAEDDFGTLRMLIQRAMAEIIGNDQTVRRVLIPRCLPIPTGG